MRRLAVVGLLLLLAQGCAQADSVAIDTGEQLAGIEFDVHQAPG